MAETIRIAARKSVVLVCDQSGGEVPSTLGGRSIAATSSCVAVACVAEDDGETEVTLGALSELARLDPPSFATRLQAPSGRLVVRSIYGEDLLSLTVDGEVVSLIIWTNHVTEPDRVIVGVG